MSADDELVLVVPTALFHELGHFHGFEPRVERYIPALTDPRRMAYLPRRLMEQDPSYKQLIPYVIFRHVDSAGRTHLFQYTRGAGQGERRLHRKRSVGVGGHICSTDHGGASGDAYREGLLRELSEEVRIDAAYEEHCVGLINDDQTEVGRVHLGIVHLCDLAAPAVWAREDDLCDAGFAPAEELLADLEGFETWSRICLEALFAR